tara:strand:+ start:473 stop:847 length:375 start_codon:yes stop_codon:yes gene_type:complete
MSFFVSDSLKDIISEKDLEADSPIKIVEGKEVLTISFYNDNTESFECGLGSISFSELLDEISIVTDTEGLANIFKSDNEKVDYSIILNGNQYMQSSGTLYLDKLEVNKEDNYVTCKIDIFKRGY